MEIKLRIQGKEFHLPIRLLLNIAENFPISRFGIEPIGNNYAAIADALIKLRLDSVNQALARSRSLPLERKKQLLEFGDLETKRILLSDAALVNRLNDSILQKILDGNDWRMLANLASHLNLPEDPRLLGSCRWPSEKMARALVATLAFHPDSGIRDAILSNQQIPDLYFPDGCGRKIWRVMKRD